MTALPAPLFPLGFPVATDFMGVVLPTHWRPAKCWVTAVKAVAEHELAELDDDGTDVTPPTLSAPGWEYTVASARTGYVWGTVSEADLLSAGYAPPVPEEAVR